MLWTSAAASRALPRPALARRAAARLVRRPSARRAPSSRRSAWTDSRGYTHFGPPPPSLFGGGGGGSGGSGGGWGPEGDVPRWRRFARAYGRGTWTLLSVVTALGGVVYFGSLQEIPYTHRRHSVLVSPAQELALGRQAFAQVLSEARAEGTLLPPSHPAVRLVEHVGRRIAAVAADGAGGGKSEHMRGLQWEFAVIESPQVNAFVVPGGKVVVYTGLLARLQSRDQLAAVLAHEVAHVLARHPAERMTRGSVLTALQLAAYVALGIAVPGGLLEAGFELPNSRRDEAEADAIGLRLAARACYDPAAAASVFAMLGHLEARQGGGGPKLLRTHPVTDDRIRAIEKDLPDAMHWYRKEGCDSTLTAFGRAFGF